MHVPSGRRGLAREHSILVESIARMGGMRRVDAVDPTARATNRW
jgi:hypothetical protein